MTSKITQSSKKVDVACLFKQVQAIIFWETLVWQRVPQIDGSDTFIIFVIDQIYNRLLQL